MTTLLLYNSFKGHSNLSIFEMTHTQRRSYLQVGQRGTKPFRCQSVLTLLKRLFVEVILSYLSLGSTKVSVVLSYVRIFSIPEFRKWAYLAVAMTVLWTILAVSVSSPFKYEASLLSQTQSIIFSRPTIQGFWLGQPPQYNYSAAQVAINVMDILLDIYILAYPLPFVKSLQMPRRRRHRVIAVLWLGSM